MDSMKGQLPNLYGILGLTIDVCKEPNCNELLKKAYLRKARLCHPDKYKGHEAAELFELLTGAYDILRDDKQRSQYNGRMNVIKESSNDFVRLRQQTTDYYSSMPEKKSTATVNIDKVSDTPLNKGESKRMITELEKNRAQQDIDLKHEKITAPSTRNSSWTTPEELIFSILYLISEEARMVNGAKIPLYGSELPL